MRTYWGDLHAHCAVSYGFGTAERALANAAAHLDFCSITGHAFWPDMPTDLERNDATMLKHLGGFAKLQRFWPALLGAAAAAERPGVFVALPSYEWHSMRHGDHNCYAAGPGLPLLDADTPAGLEAALRAAGVDPLVLPHHIGYAAGWRGIDWSVFDGRRSPVLEIFSSHGASEADDAPYPYDENMGFRHGPSTARAGLVAGHRFGFQAGSDSHDGYPGHYGHGRVGVLAERLGRAELVEALRARRTIASTGPKVAVDFELDGAGIGQAVRRRDAMRLHLRVRACDTLTRLELIEGDRDGWRVRPLPVVPAASRFVAGRHLVRVEAGWGRHGTISDWNLAARVHRGRLLAATPYFRYAGYGNDEPEASEAVLEVGDAHVTWRCRARAVPSGATSGGTHHAAGGPQTMLLEIDGDEATELAVRGGGVEVRASLPALAAGSRGCFVDGLASPALVVQRAAPEREWAALHDLTIAPPAAGGFVYLRILQADGQAAWASPVFLD
ncbi:MAG: hypothetical protein ACNA8N_09915 [Trueperaceae bacterium]